MPASVIADLVSYAEIDRADVVNQARTEWRYQRPRRPPVVDDPPPVVVKPQPGGAAHRIKVAQLDIEERRQLLIDGPERLEPAAFWLSESGMPVADADLERPVPRGQPAVPGEEVNLSAHAHLLVNTFAVVTFEQPSAGTSRRLAELSAEQRGAVAKVG